jgi:hypothetical protein
VKKCYKNQTKIRDTLFFFIFFIFYFLFFIFFFGVALHLGQLTKSDPKLAFGQGYLHLASPSWGNTLCTTWYQLVWDSGPFCYLLRPGGRFGLIPTKTPVRCIQLLGRYTLSQRTSSHVSKTVLAFRAFLPYHFLSVSTRSRVSRLLIAWSHLLWISAGVCCSSRESFRVIHLSHLSFQVR